MGEPRSRERRGRHLRNSSGNSVSGWLAPPHPSLINMSGYNGNHSYTQHAYHESTSPPSSPAAGRSPCELFLASPCGRATIEPSQKVDELVRWLMPSAASERQRTRVSRFIRKQISRVLGSIRIYNTGSFPIKTYLPSSDMDLTLAVDESSLEQSLWFSDVLSSLVTKASHQHSTHDRDNNSDSGSRCQVRKVTFINADVKLVTCVVNNISVDITANKFRSVAGAAFLAEADRIIGNNHLLVRSVLLIKAWCLLDSCNFVDEPILGSHDQRLGSYALYTLILQMFNTHSDTVSKNDSSLSESVKKVSDVDRKKTDIVTCSIKSPFHALVLFFETYADFQWDRYTATVSGRVETDRLVLAAGHQFNITVSSTESTGNCGGFITPELVSRFRQRPSKASSVSKNNRSSDQSNAKTGTDSPWGDRHRNSAIRSAFQNRPCCILDPLDQSNNLGRSVSRENLVRFQAALHSGRQHLNVSLGHFYYGAAVANAATKLSGKTSESRPLPGDAVATAGSGSTSANANSAAIHNGGYAKSDMNSATSAVAGPSFKLGIEVLCSFFGRSMNRYARGDGFREDLLRHPCEKWTWRPPPRLSRSRSKEVERSASSGSLEKNVIQQSESHASNNNGVTNTRDTSSSRPFSPGCKPRRSGRNSPSLLKYGAAATDNEGHVSPMDKMSTCSNDEDDDEPVGSTKWVKRQMSNKHDLDNNIPQKENETKLNNNKSSKDLKAKTKSGEGVDMTSYSVLEQMLTVSRVRALEQDMLDAELCAERISRKTMEHSAFSPFRTPLAVPPAKSSLNNAKKNIDKIPHVKIKDVKKNNENAQQSNVKLNNEVVARDRDNSIATSSRSKMKTIEPLKINTSSSPTLKKSPKSPRRGSLATVHSVESEINISSEEENFWKPSAACSSSSASEKKSSRDSTPLSSSTPVQIINIPSIESIQGGKSESLLKAQQPEMCASIAEVKPSTPDVVPSRSRKRLEDNKITKQSKKKMDNVRHAVKRINKRNRKQGLSTDTKNLKANTSRQRKTLKSKKNSGNKTTKNKMKSKPSLFRNIFVFVLGLLGIGLVTFPLTIFAYRHYREIISVDETGIKLKFTGGWKGSLSMSNKATVSQEDSTNECSGNGYLSAPDKTVNNTSVPSETRCKCFRGSFGKLCESITGNFTSEFMFTAVADSQEDGTVLASKNVPSYTERRSILTTNASRGGYASQSENVADLITEKQKKVPIFKRMASTRRGKPVLE